VPSKAEVSSLADVIMQPPPAQEEPSFMLGDMP
jgi:replicative superfamily II helicase